MTCEPPRFDHGLLLRSQTDATGANVHQMNNLAQNYLACWEVYSRQGWNQKRLNTFLASERKLRAALNRSRLEVSDLGQSVLECVPIP